MQIKKTIGRYKIEEFPTRFEIISDFETYSITDIERSFFEKLNTEADVSCLIDMLKKGLI